MPSAKELYDPSNDNSLLTLQCHENGEGNYFNTDTTIFFSPSAGYYKQERKVQVWRERCWEDCTEEELSFAPAHAKRRVLECPCSPLTAGQVIRMVVEYFVPEEGDARAIALAILDDKAIR
jgi:hypothetical protein